MTTQIHCTNPRYGELHFYLLHDSAHYYLFSQPYRRQVFAFYKQGVPLKNALSYSKAKRDDSLMKTTSKFPSAIHYIESEYGIAIMEQTKRRKATAA